MGNITEPPNEPHSPRSNPALAHERFFQLVRDSGKEVLKSDEGAHIIRFKRELVLSLFLKHGHFWNEIQSMREKWNINASKQLVPSGVWCPYPMPLPNERDLGQWTREINALRDRTIPQRYLNCSVDWHRFIPACVLYNPPEDELIEFAYFAGLSPTAPRPMSPEEEEAMGDDWNLLMVAPPTVHLRDASKEALAETWHFRAILQRIGDRYLKPQGIDIWDLYYEVRKDSPDIAATYAEMHRSNLPKLYIRVEEWTTESDVRNAFRLIRQTQPKARKGGRPKLDSLLAVQCAVLYDRHNHRDPEDSRRWRWTFEKLAEQFGLESKKTAKRHVELGREILAKTRV
jgi:hypothetical protein